MEPAERLSQGGREVFLYAIAKGLLINAMRREIFLWIIEAAAWWRISKGVALSAIVMRREIFPVLLLRLISAAWRGMSTKALSTIAMQREIFWFPTLLLRLLLLPAAWRGVSTKALSAIAMPREMFLFPLLPLPGAWRGLAIAPMSHTRTATATATRQ